jgi:hypothetical protein
MRNIISLVPMIIVLSYADYAAAQAPTPIQKKAPTWTTPGEWKPFVRQPRAYTDWRRFQGATRCEQSGDMVSCDNGYRANLR